MGKDTIFCMNCGQKLPAEAKFCFACGQRVETDSYRDAAGGASESAPCRQEDMGSPAESGGTLTLAEFRAQAPSQTGFREQLFAYRKSLPHNWDHNAFVGILLGVGGPKHGDAACMNFAIGQGDNGNNTKKTLDAKGLMPVFEKYKGKNLDAAILLSDVEDEILAIAPEYAPIRDKFHEIVFAGTGGESTAAEGVSAPRIPTAPEEAVSVSQAPAASEEVVSDEDVSAFLSEFLAPAPAEVLETDPSYFIVEDCVGGCRIGQSIIGRIRGSAVIPSHIGGKKVVEIDKEAFAECGRLTSVTIPDGVTAIGERAFSGCLSLRSITIPNSVTKIGKGAFEFCKALTGIIIPGSITEISDKMFSQCDSLTSVTIPDGVTAIGNVAFGGCTGLTSLTIPNSVTKIGEYAFSNCTSLTSITIPDSVMTVGPGTFVSCSKLTVRAPAGSDAAWRAEQCQVQRVEYIPSRILPEHFETEACAGGCRIKKYVGPRQNNLVIPPYIGGKRVVEIASEAFSKSWILTGITIPDGVTEIAEHTFFECHTLTSVTIPDSVTKIGVSAFFRCTSLTSITIPNSVTEIGKSAFDNCKSLTSMTIPNGVTKISNSVFSCCKSLTSVTIPNGVTEIGGSAFSGCDSLININIPSSVTKIDGGAFFHCTSLASLTVPASVTKFGYDAFGEKIYCGLTRSSDKLTIYAPAGSAVERYAKKYGIPFRPLAGTPAATAKVQDPALSFFKVEACAGGCRIKKYTGRGGPEVIPPHIGGKKVVEIGEDAFSYCKSLTSVTIPNGVTRIGKNAFEHCENLTSLTIPGSVTDIVLGAFFGCNNLTVHAPAGSYAARFADLCWLPVQPL